MSFASHAHLSSQPAVAALSLGPRRLTRQRERGRSTKRFPFLSQITPRTRQRYPPHRSVSLLFLRNVREHNNNHSAVWCQCHQQQPQKQSHSKPVYEVLAVDEGQCTGKAAPAVRLVSVALSLSRTRIILWPPACLATGW